MNNPFGRDRWASRSAFILAAVGSAVGLGNIWRYPHVAYSGGGGAFLLPYFLALFTAGIPLLMLEFGLGHRMQGAAPMAMGRVKRSFEFTGWWAAFGGLFITLFYCALMGWVCYYIWELFEVVLTGADALPWEAAGAPGYLLSEVITGTPGYEQAEGDFSRMNWWAVMFSALVWGFVFFAIRNGVHSVGKVVWVTVLLPYLLLFVLFFTAIGLEGASSGLNYYLSPDWSKYADETGSFSFAKTAQITSLAYGQIFFSLSIGFGIMMAYASFLPKRADVANNAVITGFVNSGTEFFGGIITFCVLGFLAGSVGRFTGDVVGSSSIGIAFFSYPTAISQITDSATTNALIGLSFFGCLLFLGVDSAFSLVEAAVAGICDKFGLNRRTTAAAFCTGGWLIGLVYCTPGGLALLDSADYYLTNYGLLTLGAMQCIVVGWVYGPKRLRRHIDAVSEWKLVPVWDLCIKYLTPGILIFILFSNLSRDLPSLWDPNVKPYSGYGLATQLFGMSMVVMAAVLAVILSRRAPARLDYYDRPEAADTEPESDDDTPSTGGGSGGRSRLSAPMLWIGLAVAGAAIAVFAESVSPRQFGLLMLGLASVSGVAGWLRSGGKGAVGRFVPLLIAPLGLLVAGTAATTGIMWYGLVLALAALLPPVVRLGVVKLRRLRPSAVIRTGTACLLISLVGWLASGCKPVKPVDVVLTSDEKALIEPVAGAPTPKDAPAAALERATNAAHHAITMPHPTEPEERKRSMEAAKAILALASKLAAEACPNDLTGPHREAVSEWAASSQILSLLLSDLNKLTEAYTALERSGVELETAVASARELDRGTLAPVLQGMRDDTKSTSKLHQALRNIEEWDVASVRTLHAMALNRMTLDVLALTKPIRAALPQENRIAEAIDRSIFPLNPHDFRMIQPYQRLSPSQVEEFKAQLQRVAWRYPGGRVAKAWDSRERAGTVVNTLSEDDSGFGARTLVDWMVEDIYDTWGDYRPAEQFRIYLVRLYSAKTTLTSPDGQALWVLLFGSLVLFGGLAWSVTRAVRGKPQSDV